MFLFYLSEGCFELHIKRDYWLLLNRLLSFIDRILNKIPTFLSAYFKGDYKLEVCANNMQSKHPHLLEMIFFLLG